jgi:LacI family transcriptional regulator
LATIRDVARAAGVSIATVSRVYNNNELVSHETADRILEVAARLDYWPNRAAQSLTTRRTHTFGVLLPDLFSEFYSELIRGIDLAARRDGYQILLSSAHAHDESVLTASRTMLGRIDGIIMMAPEEESMDAVARLRRRVPVVLLNPRQDVPACHSVSVTNYRGARDAVRHLIGLGHRDIALVAGPPGNVDADERRRGFRQALAEADLDPGAALVVPGDFRESAGYAAGVAVLARRPRPTAVFAANDSMAIGLLAALRKGGCRVPEDIAVVGFDDITMARYLSPALTTVHVDACGLGQQAVRLMLGDDANTVAPRRRRMTTSLRIRQSCGAGQAGPGSGSPEESQLLAHPAEEDQP